MGLFDFDLFALKDIGKQIGKDPERLLMGAVDPLSTKMWNGITGKDYEPLVDQMGGPYGGHTISAFGKNDGGVYKRAEEAGIDTKKGAGMHDAAHVVAAIYGGQGLMNAGQGMFGSQSIGGNNIGTFAQNAGSNSGWQGLLNNMQQPMGGMGMPGMPQQQQQQEGPKPYWINGRIVYI